MEIGDFDNRLIKKTVIHTGKEFKRMSPGTKVKFHFITRKRDDDLTVIDDSRKMGKPMELIIGKQFKLEVWESIIQAMAINEVSSFVVDKSLVHAYPLVSRTLRDAQHPERPRSRHCCGHMLQSYGLDHEDLNTLLRNPCDLEFIIELLLVENAGEYEQETWQLNEKERLDEVPKLKEEGNILFKNGNYTEAVLKYSRAIGFLDQLMLCEKPGEPEWKNLQDKKMAVLLNYAQCKLILKEYYEVIEHCTTVLQYDSACIALMNFHLHYLFLKDKLEEWHSEETMSAIKALAAILLIVVVGFLSWYIFRIFFEHLSVFPIKDSVIISSVWTFMTVKWALLLYLTSNKYGKVLHTLNFNRPLLSSA